jgi:hypothetical protein
MKNRIIYQPISFLTKSSLILFLALPNLVYGQQNASITFQKLDSKYQKTFKLPVSLRCVMHDGHVQIIQLDSIADNVMYGNKGADSISLNKVKVIHIRGLTEISKITLATTSFTIAGAALWFATYAAMGNPIATHTDSKTFVLPALAYTTVFSSTGALVLSKPKTRFKVKKYHIINQSTQ